MAVWGQAHAGESVVAARIVVIPKERAISVVIEIDNGSAAPIGQNGVAVTLLESADNPCTERRQTAPQRLRRDVNRGGKDLATSCVGRANDARNPVTIRTPRGNPTRCLRRRSRQPRQGRK